ncbi:MAG: methionine gamma-lyase family protein, partial [Clostridia bacterium]|nr:methionine gamma-lyase family protein [Clostridia bacterium]
MEILQSVWELAARAEAALAPRFADVERVSFENTKKVLDAFRDHRVSEAMFAPTSGYGYDDRGRDTLDAVWAQV